MQEILAFAEMILVVIFIPIVVWLRSIATSVDELMAQMKGNGVEHQIEKMSDTFAREHKEASEKQSRDHLQIQEDLRNLGKDLQEKVSKIMHDHNSHEKQNVALELMVKELVEYKRRELSEK